MARGKVFKCASGMSDADRTTPLYKCQELTNDGVPRFPVYLGIAANKTQPKDLVIANQQGLE